jgi:hypothetical protein
VEHDKGPYQVVMATPWLTSARQDKEEEKSRGVVVGGGIFGVVGSSARHADVRLGGLWNRHGL